MARSQIPTSIQPEIDDALSRAHAAGAVGRLSYVGHGMYGIVFCDERGHAWKVFRLDSRYTKGVNMAQHDLFLREALETEYEWLKSAQESLEARHVARAHSVDLEHLVLERDCVAGQPGGWGDERRLSDLHRRITLAMEPLGWSSPEFKADSYVLTPDGEAVLVDASMAMRIGRRLLEFVADVLDGKRFSYETPSTLAFFVLRELHHGLSEAEAMPVLERLMELDPEIARQFQVPGQSTRKAVLGGMSEHSRGGLWMKGRRYHIDISKSRERADVRDEQGRPFTMLNLGDMEDLLSVASHIRAGRPWEKSGRFIGDQSKDGHVIVDVKNGIRMKGMSREDVAELVLMSEEAVLAML